MDNIVDNLDPAEAKKFEAMASEWWDKQGKCRPLHDLNPTRLQFMVDRVSLEGKRILDIGCGAGILSESLAKRGGCVTGIDAVPELINVARQHMQEHLISPQSSPSLQYESATAESYANLHPHAFDIVACMELLEHVPDPLSLIQATAELLVPGGHAFFSTLNRTPKSFFLAILGAEYLLKLLPQNTHQYSKFIKPSELEKGLKQANLKLLDIKGLHYNPLTHQAKLTNDVSVNYIVHAIKSK